MAQSLKPDIREKILAAGKVEFLNHGYESASLRHIASMADMTVGNLYRYFDNKEAINEAIVGNTLNKIDEMVRRISNEGVKLYSSSFDLKFNVHDLKEMLDELADELVDIFVRAKDEFRILLLNSELNNKLTDWFGTLISGFIESKYPLKGFDQEKDLMAKAFAVSILDGIKIIFNEQDLAITKLKLLIRIYFHAYIEMLDGDLRKMLE